MSAGIFSDGVSFDEALEALIDNDALYEIAAQFPTHPLGSGGRPRTYPNYIYIVFMAMVTQGTSARKAAVALGSLRNWRWLQGLVRSRFPDDPTMHLPDEPIRRYHWTYWKRRYGTVDPVLAAIKVAFEDGSARQTSALGLCRPDGPGSLSHPDLSRMIYGDGKVVTPLYRAKRGDTKRDKETGEVTPVRADPDAIMHTTGGGEPAFGNKYVMMAVRGQCP